MTGKRIRVEVTERDIERAHRSDSYLCVVAQAIARTVPDATRIEVDTQSIRFTTEGKRLLYLTPYAVQGYVIAFDAGDPIEPFTFQLRDARAIRRRLDTKAGQAANGAARQAKRQKTPDDGTGGGLPVPSSDARVAYAEARAAHPGLQARETVSPGPHAPPRVFKKKARAYGHRLLRINRQAQP